MQTVFPEYKSEIVLGNGNFNLIPCHILIFMKEKKSA